jgi:beta-lactamase regulating signal transducer with metallopeptidase domain
MATSQLPQLLDTLQAISQSAAAALVSHLWQSIVLAAAVAVCIKLAPATTAALRFTIWSASFAVLVSLPLLPAMAHALLPTRQIAGHAASALDAPALAVSHPAWLQIDARWGMAIAALWFAASLYRAVDLSLHIARLRRLWRNAQPVDLESLPALCQSALSTSQRRCATLCTTPDLDRPSVIGFFAPRILIPAWLLGKLTPAELDQVILHESEHLRRGDDWTNLFQKLSLILFPLNPALIFIERQLCREREMACDEGVIRRTHAPRAYATVLTRLAESTLERAAEALSLGSLGNLATFGRRSELVTRVHSILRSSPVLSPAATRRLLAGSLLGMLLVSVELYRCPELVAFVAQPHPALQAASAQASLNFRQAGITPVSSAGQPASAYRMLPAVARLTSANPASSGIASRAAHTAASSSAQPANMPPATHVISAPTQAYLSEPAVALQQAASAPSAAGLALSSPQPAAVPASISERGAQPGWILLTAWTAEEPSSWQQDADLSSGEAATQLPPQPSPDSLGQTRPAQAQPEVTRLVFKIPSPGPGQRLFTPTFAAVPTRMGWLIIQL